MVHHPNVQPYPRKFTAKEIYLEGQNKKLYIGDKSTYLQHHSAGYIELVSDHTLVLAGGAWVTTRAGGAEQLAVGTTYTKVVKNLQVLQELLVTGMMSGRRDAADYGGGFATYTPPTGREAAMLVVEDTNATTPGRRLYVYSGATWRYVALS